MHKHLLGREVQRMLIGQMKVNWSTGDGSDGDDGYPNSTSHTAIIANF